MSAQHRNLSTQYQKESVVTLLLPLLPAKLRPYAKTVLAVLGTVVSALALTYGDNVIVATAVQVLTVLGVYAQPNGTNGEGEDYPADGLPENELTSEG